MDKIIRKGNLRHGVNYKIFYAIFTISSMYFNRKIFIKKYVYRLNELEEMKNALNIFESKIRFTYEPIPEIFGEISKNSSSNISNIFKKAKEKMKEKNASQAWEETIDESDCNFSKEDKQVLKTLSKLLGQTDSEGQISQIEMKNYIQN